MITRRTFLKLSGLLSASLVCPGFAKESGSQKPNIVLLVADDLGWNDIGYHNPEIKTPQLDSLMGDGVELNWHYVQPQCTPTRVALMTGRYPSRFGSHCTQASNDHAFSFDTLTMASMLKSVGYETALSGKWHLGSKPEWGPNHHGFDHSYGSFSGAVGMLDHRYRLKSPFVQTWHRNHEFVDESGHATDLVTREAVRWIEKKRAKPYFLYVPFHSVHTPLVEEEKWLGQNSHIENKSRRLFAAALTHLDDCISRIIDAIDRSGQRENTLIIFISDNGGIHKSYGGGNYPAPDPALEAGFSSNLPLRGGKSTVYEGGLRVPAFVNWKGQLNRRKVDVPCHAVDWLPTIAKLIGFEAKDEFKWDGIDLWPYIEARKKSLKDRQLYWVWGNTRKKIALRDGKWKMLRSSPKDKWELYNLKEDPNEENDLAQQNPQRLAKLQELLEIQKSKDKL